MGSAGFAPGFCGPGDLEPLAEVVRCGVGVVQSTRLGSGWTLRVLALTCDGEHTLWCRSRGVENATLLGEEGPVSFVADLGKHTRRRRERIRDKHEIAHGRCPLHLCRIVNEFARKATATGGRVRVPDL